MESEAFKKLYSTETDDELADQQSLTPEARSALANELARRDLFVQHHSTRIESDTTLDLKQNPAFNAPAKVGSILLAIFAVGSLAFFLSLMVLEDDWKRVLSRFALLMLLIWGPIFAAFAWATRRNLRNAQTGLRSRKR